jgi:NhaA family Na+:H+ antiporter
VSLASWIAVRMGIARLPEGVQWRHVLGAAWLAGIGFTMSLFIAQLAFTDAAQIDEAKLGILIASSLCAVVGLAWLYVAGRPVSVEAGPK